MIELSIINTSAYTLCTYIQNTYSWRVLKTGIFSVYLRIVVLRYIVYSRL